MNKRRRILVEEIVPKDFDGNPIETDDKFFELWQKMERVAQKRTHRFALQMCHLFKPIKLEQALMAAYVQGMYDATNNTATYPK